MATFQSAAPLTETTGKKLTEEERRAVLHCHEMCEQEGASSIRRTAHYLGIAAKTIKDVLNGINSEDGRGRYMRSRPAEVFEPYILNLVDQWNTKGTPVTIKKLHKALRTFWGDTHTIPSNETIRKLLHKQPAKAPAGCFFDDGEILNSRPCRLETMIGCDQMYCCVDFWADSEDSVGRR